MTSHVELTVVLITLLTGNHAAVTDGELSDFMQSIWNGDVNAATDVRINLQSHTSTSSSIDRASGRLFSYVNDAFTLSRPTYAALIRLHDNYNHVVGQSEHSSRTEEHEISNFLNEISKTSVMQKTLTFLSREGTYVYKSDVTDRRADVRLFVFYLPQVLVRVCEIFYPTRTLMMDSYNHTMQTDSRHREEETQNMNSYCYPQWSSLEQNLRQLWFTPYPRHGHTYDSSGFEHVFVGETDSREVVGLHNWVQFHIEERDKDLDYLGYVFSKQPNTVGAHYEWYGKQKKLGTMMYGTSPEFDIAMFTVCYYARKNGPCSFSINGHHVEVVTYDTTHGGGHHIGTAYVN